MTGACTEFWKGVYPLHPKNRYFAGRRGSWGKYHPKIP